MKLNFISKTKAPKAQTSDFSTFFRKASSSEKKRVFKEVARKASEDQKRVIESVSKLDPSTV